MRDVSPKFHSLRYALAEGFLRCSPDTVRCVAEKKVPKGDIYEVARAAGILAGKRCGEWIVFCHPIPLDWIDVTITLEERGLRVQAEVRSVWKTGVEMEAMSAVSAALLNAYDMLKPLDSALSISDVRLISKEGGKSDFENEGKEVLPAAVLVISDSTFAGSREDTSGKLIMEYLEDQPVSVEAYDILPDDEEVIAKKLKNLVDEKGIRLLFTTGGTGLGLRDRTPEATLKVIDKEVRGIAEAIRRHGRERTPYAMLSRGIVGVRGKSVVVNLPGSRKGVKESLDALFPGLLHAFPMIEGEGHR